MEKVDIIKGFAGMSSEGIVSLNVLVLNLLIGFVLSLVVTYHYKKFSTVLSNKSSISSVIPFIILTITLIISIVKSSLALSLGLVGALSIVRFRTPIKEPEELAYLFICIGIGLGLGANQTLNTIVAGLIILLIMAIVKKKSLSSSLSKNYYLSIEMNNSLENDLSDILKIVSSHSHKLDMRRYQISDDNCSVVFFVDLKDEISLIKITNELKKNYEGITVSFIDQSNMPSI